MAFLPNNTEDIRFWACSALASPAREQVEAIFVEAFPDVEREPFDDLVQSIDGSSRLLYCASNEEGVVGFSVICPLLGGQVMFLEYCATERTTRGRGLGTRLLQALVQYVKDNTSTAAIALEVESDEHGLLDDRQLKARRIGFYERNGARRIDAVTDYRMPNMIGPGSLPMKLLWLPVRAKASVPQGEELKDLILGIYNDVYHRGADDPLVRAILSSISSDNPKLTLWGDFNHDGIVDTEHERPDRSQAYVIALPVPDLQNKLAQDLLPVLGMGNVHPAETGKITVHVEGECPSGSRIILSVAGPARDKVAVFGLFGARWIYIEGRGEWTIPCGAELQDNLTIGVVSRCFTGEDGWNGEFVLAASIQDSLGKSIASDTIAFRTAPFVLASALDQVKSVLVADNPRSANLVAALRSTLTPLGIGLEPISVDDGFENDVWVQDAVEIGGVCVPSKEGIKQAVAVLPGIRALHAGITCGPLDRAIRDHFARRHGLVADIAEPRAAQDWIDWFGNLEVSPPVIAADGRSFPLGRVLTGRQGTRSMHPDVMAFLQAQQVQWPPLVIDTSWLEIGHVDEVVNFVPVPDALGFRVLFPSVRLARDILEAAMQHDLGIAPVFAGHQFETTVQELLEGIALSEENRRVQEILSEIKAQIREGLGIEDACFVELPALFRDGVAVIPNLVNSLVVGKHLFAPDPIGPEITGEDAFAAVMTQSLNTLGLQVQFIDVWDYYHLNAGEIHCGTNAVRCIAHPEWWLHFKEGQDR